MTVEYTPSRARAHLFEIIQGVTSQHVPVRITPANGKPGVVVISTEDWESIEETLYLEATGALAQVRSREADSSGFTDVDDLDWDNL
ncbi:MAG: type II toxin-antitoxin system Phd/YefM family antitoxin [Bifidobacteriaceae bacterium]|nr:type II toxin-antitoxin system Phd/YefM family antitoxin [Bifidobacteriaceae bacterium]